MEAKLVTGYIPIQGHPRTAAEYGELGEIFAKLDCKNFSIHPFYETVPDTWLSKLIGNQPYSVSHSVADNPKKNTVAYHCVQHQKFAWLLKAAIADPKPDVYVWMDYGIAHVPGVTAAVIQDFMDNLKPDDFAVPGCWDENCVISDFFPCWRFCGGVMVVPRKQVHKLFKGVKYAAAQHLQKHRNVTWEVNTLAEAERAALIPPVRWYKADHNQTLFTAYGDFHAQREGSDGVRAAECPAPVAGSV